MTFTESNFPNMPNVSGASVSAMTQLTEAYAGAKSAFESHVNKDANADPHGMKTYVDQQVSEANNIARTAKNLAKRLEHIFIGDKDLDAAGFGQTVEDFAKKKLDNKSVLQFITALVNRMETLEAEYNKLSLLQFDNVPVGAGIRWWKDTLPEDGTYVWANGQTLYGVNQNFPELARAWELGSADNVKVPKEDHTIFKVRKATVEVKPIEHAYIAPAEGTAPNDILGAIAELKTAVAALQQGA